MSEPYIQTYSGTEFWSLSPRSRDVKIIDIAHALSNKCRFAGHCKTFYSVAQHSVLVSRQLPKEQRLWGLLHDAGEAYFADIPNPIKRMHDLFDQIEEPIMKAVAEQFGLVWPMPKTVKVADKILLATEARDLLPVVWKDWHELWQHMALEFKIEAVSPIEAKAMFLEEFCKLWLEEGE